MKKVLYTLLAVSIIFAACKKEDDEVVAATVSIVGTWTPNSSLLEQSETVTVAGVEVYSSDTSYTMTSTDADWEFTDVQFTSAGEMISDGDTSSYSHSGNVLTITEDVETETHTFTVTSTSLNVIMNDTEEETIDYMGQEGTANYSFNMTLNCTRQ
jgi:hypothetical protein